MIQITFTQVFAMRTFDTEHIGCRCRLLVPVRDHHGHVRFDERPILLNEVFNLGRHMYLVEFGDGTTMYLFEHEISLERVKVPSARSPRPPTTSR